MRHNLLLLPLQTHCLRAAAVASAHRRLARQVKRHLLTKCYFWTTICLQNHFPRCQHWVPPPPAVHHHQNLGWMQRRLTQTTLLLRRPRKPLQLCRRVLCKCRRRVCPRLELARQQLPLHHAHARGIARPAAAVAWAIVAVASRAASFGSLRPMPLLRSTSPAHHTHLRASRRGPSRCADQRQCPPPLPRRGLTSPGPNRARRA